MFLSTFFLFIPLLIITHPKTTETRFFGTNTPSKSPKCKRLNSFAWQYIKRLRDVRGTMEQAGYSESSIIKVRAIFLLCL